ncbi:cytosolic 5'-nucleotidase 3-like [Paramacrobiotus metropolitanus]|uniref:cytosolic 5'-nucleotidase 3-like n=1 Tax=Paramacrobiotus metropolitanus TaxID=2943436 RepID=UPI002445F768|nr:cytosolic 5'-nucleotidase 3-like [Paramacrobiotus metropolitanus]
MESQDGHLKRLHSFIKLRAPTEKQLFGIAMGVGAVAGACVYLRYNYPSSNPTDCTLSEKDTPDDLILDHKSTENSELSTRLYSADVSGKQHHIFAPSPILPSSVGDHDTARDLLDSHLPVNHADIYAHTIFPSMHNNLATASAVCIGENDAALAASIPLKLEQVLFSSPNIAIRDGQHVRKVIHNLINDGDHRLQIITDFDYTLTRYAKNGDPCDTTYQVVEQSETMPKEYREMTAKLRNKYLPMQQNPDLSPKEREDGMHNWLTKSHELMKQYKVRVKDIPKCVQNSSATLRAKVPIFLSKVGLRKVPVTIFSAGLSAVVKEILEHQVCLSDNITVVANEFSHNDEGYVTDFREPLVHGLNKALIVSSRAEYFAQYKSRHNIILIGDSLADAQMAATLPQTQNLLKIGFLVQDFDLAIDLYKEVFDIVIVDQESFAVVHDIVEFILTAQNQLSSTWELERLERAKSYSKLW